MSRFLKNIGFVFVGFLIASYVFILNGYKTEILVPGSDTWQQLEAAGKLPKKVELSETELYSNGYVLSVVGLVTNPHNIDLAFTKVSADLINIEGKVYHKCTGFAQATAAKSESQFKFHCANIKDIDYQNHASAKIYTDS